VNVNDFTAEEKKANCAGKDFGRALLIAIEAICDDVEQVESFIRGVNYVLYGEFKDNQPHHDSVQLRSPYRNSERTRTEPRRRRFYTPRGMNRDEY